MYLSFGKRSHAVRVRGENLLTFRLSAYPLTHVLTTCFPSTYTACGLQPELFQNLSDHLLAPAFGEDSGITSQNELFDIPAGGEQLRA